jgi:hypothetical protein
MCLNFEVHCFGNYGLVNVIFSTNLVKKEKFGLKNIEVKQPTIRDKALFVSFQDYVIQLIDYIST